LNPGAPEVDADGHIGVERDIDRLCSGRRFLAPTIVPPDWNA
jgi:hypothetical protein